MAFVIGKQFSFAAAHHLTGLPAGHKCSRLHGHTYQVEVQLTSPALDGPGFVADYQTLEPLGRYLQAELDHRDLNEVLPFQPTCENLARHLFGWCRGNLPAGPLVCTVRVSESPHTWAEYQIAPGTSTGGPAVTP
jgi:6-pyruvoyltetrahydropterin/6-carboxytetrahydropterin synthase